MKEMTLKQKRTLEEIAAKTITILPFQDDNAEKRAVRLRTVTGEGWDSFRFFCETYFPHVFTLGWCPDHEDMFREVDEHHGVTAITGFRGLGKTVLMGVVYPIWRIIKGERYVIHTAADVDLAEERTGFTLNELTNNKRLQADFPELTPLDTDEENYYLRNKCRIRARSIKQSHRGTINPKCARRPGLIVCDDIDKEENQGNQTIGRRRKDKILEELAGALAPSGHGRVLWLGNLVHPNYAICQFAAQLLSTPDVVVPERGAVRINDLAVLRYPLENADGTSVWEEQYPTASIPNLRAKIGNAGYQREMLGRPVIEGNIFKHDWFQRWNPPLPTFKRVWLYADPAWGKKGCYKGVISMGWDGTRFYALHVWVRQTDNTKFFRYYYEAYKELARTYGARFRAAAETVFGQQRILEDFDRWAKDNDLPPISGFIRRIETKEDKSLRIERMETPIETGKVLFPVGQDTDVLISQFLTYPDGYIDGPDAVAGCLERFAEYNPSNRVKVRRMSC